MACRTYGFVHKQTNALRLQVSVLVSLFSVLVHLWRDAVVRYIPFSACAFALRYAGRTGDDDVNGLRWTHVLCLLQRVNLLGLSTALFFVPGRRLL